MKKPKPKKERLRKELHALRKRADKLERRLLSERKKAEEYESLFDLSSDLVCLAGLNGFYKRVNPAFERILGYTEEESLSRPFLEFIHPEDREAARRAWT